MQRAEKGTVTGRPQSTAGSPTPKFIQLVRAKSVHFVTLCTELYTKPCTECYVLRNTLTTKLASYRQIVGKLTCIFERKMHVSVCYNTK